MRLVDVLLAGAVAEAQERLRVRIKAACEADDNAVVAECGHLLDVGDEVISGLGFGPEDWPDSVL